MSRSASWIGDHARGARRDLRDDRSGEAVLHRDLRRGHRARERGDRERADLARALVADRVGAVDDLLHAAAAGVDDDRDAVALLGRHRREVDARASSTASVAAATPKWMNRLIRRAILRSIAGADRSP